MNTDTANPLTYLFLAWASGLSLYGVSHAIVWTCSLRIVEWISGPRD